MGASYSGLKGEVVHPFTLVVEMLSLCSVQYNKNDSFHFRMVLLESLHGHRAHVISLVTSLSRAC